MNADERERFESDIRWLASRIEWPPHNMIGISSNALVVAAVLGTEVPESSYPRDRGDFERCVYACVTAPSHRKEQAYSILTRFKDAMEARAGR